jgi:hypothetical protein
MVKKSLPGGQAVQDAAQSPWHGSCKPVRRGAPAACCFRCVEGFQIMFFSIIEEVASFASVFLFITAVAVWSDVLARIF